MGRRDPFGPPTAHTAGCGQVIEDVIGSPDCLTGLLTVLHGGSNGAKLLALEVIALLTNHAKLLSECIRRGAVVYLLEVVGR